ncbi:uncharacterized protein V1518DRAFT_419179 [Limtongia smithiae]|uniref:uncharacterized protein n=1 Tax=Limtongia smithiae TaxID=1125753 RepID=UPI0034CF91D7
MPRQSSSKKLPGHLVEFEPQLHALLATRPPYHNDVNTLVSAFRDAAEEAMLTDIVAAHTYDLDTVIWIRCHYPVIEAFRRLIHKLRSSTKPKVVESRKLKEFFVSFVKGSIQFYRRFIQSLAQVYGVNELKPVLVRFHLELAKSEKSASTRVRFLVLSSAHRSLVSLGDLSRYREVYSGSTEPNEEKNWRPAINYYVLAKQVIPTFGVSHNQLAVIASLDGSILSSTYHFYRAICVQEKFPTAKANLELNFKKYLNSDDKGKVRRKEEYAVAELLDSFLEWLAKVVTTNAEPANSLSILQDEIISRIAAAIVERLLTGDVLAKIALISMSAYYLAEPATDVSRDLLFLNLGILQVLLRVLYSELEEVRRAATGMAEIQSSTLSPASRRILACLRMYSSWLRTIAITSLVDNDDPMMQQSIEDMWRQYAQTLSSLAVLFGSLSFEKTDVLLNEDIDLIGFLPLESGLTGVRASAKTFTLTEIEEFTSRLHPSQEVILRVSDILTDAHALTNMDAVPLISEDKQFGYCAPRRSSTPMYSKQSIPPPDFNSLPLHNLQQDNGMHRKEKGHRAKALSTATNENSVSHMMYAMVDSLVDDGADDIGNQVYPNRRDGFSEDDDDSHAVTEPVEEPRRVPAAPVYNAFGAPSPWSVDKPRRTVTHAELLYPESDTYRTSFSAAAVGIPSLPVSDYRASLMFNPFANTAFSAPLAPLSSSPYAGGMPNVEMPFQSLSMSVQSDGSSVTTGRVSSVRPPPPIGSATPLPQTAAPPVEGTKKPANAFQLFSPPQVRMQQARAAIAAAAAQAQAPAAILPSVPPNDPVMGFGAPQTSMPLLPGAVGRPLGGQQLLRPSSIVERTSSDAETDVDSVIARLQHRQY